MAYASWQRRKQQVNIVQHNRAVRIAAGSGFQELWDKALASQLPHCKVQIGDAFIFMQTLQLRCL